MLPIRIPISVLYKEGPPFYHSSYSVLVCPTNADDSESGLATLPSNWTEMSCLVRVTEQVAKVKRGLNFFGSQWQET